MSVDQPLLYGQCPCCEGENAFEIEVYDDDGRPAPLFVTCPLCVLCAALTYVVWDGPHLPALETEEVEPLVASDGEDPEATWAEDPFLELFGDDEEDG